MQSHGEETPQPALEREVHRQAKDSRFGCSAVARGGSHREDSILVPSASCAGRQDEKLAAVALDKVAVGIPLVAKVAVRIPLVACPPCRCGLATRQSLRSAKLCKMAWRVQDARMGEIAVRDEGVGGQPVDECVPRLSIEVIPKSTWVDAVDELRMREAENPRRSKGIRDREPSAGSVRFFPKSAALRCAAGLARASAREMPRVRTRWCTPPTSLVALVGWEGRAVGVRDEGKQLIEADCLPILLPSHAVLVSHFARHTNPFGRVGLLATKLTERPKLAAGA